MAREAGNDIIERILSRASHDGALPAFADAHCHLGLMANGAELAAQASQAGLTLLSMGVEPARFAHESACFGAQPGVHVGLGAHPWWVPEADAKAAAEMRDAFDMCFDSASIIGEVGLDFAPRHLGAADDQVALLTHIFARCAERSGLFISIHAVRSGATVLDLLEASGAHRGNAVAFHWFSGNSAELQRALGLGCLFSVNERMLATRRGRASVRALPQDRILLETDAPSEDGATCQIEDIAAQLLRTAQLAEDVRQPQAAR